MTKKLSLLLAAAALSTVAVQADVLIANRFNSNVLKSDSTGLSGWTAFATYVSQARNVASDGTNVFIGTVDNAVYSYNAAGTQTGTNNPGAGGTGRVGFASGTAAFNGFFQAGSDNNIRRYGAAPVGAPISTTSIGWSPGAAASVRTIAAVDYLFTPGAGATVRRNVVTAGTPISNATLTFQGQGTNFAQTHFFAAPNGDKFFGGTIAAGVLGGVYLDNTTNFGTVADSSTISGAFGAQKLTFANAAATVLDPGTTIIRDMAFDPYSDTGIAASFYVLSDINRLYKYSYTYADNSFTLLGTSTGGTSTLAINQGLQLAFTSAIPEPSTYAALAGLGALGLAVLRRRRAA